MLKYTKDKAQLLDIIKIINTGRFYSLTFAKVDGSIRRLNGKKKIYRDNVTGEIKEIPLAQPTRLEKGLLLVWDNNAPDYKTGERGAYRSSKLENIMLIKSGQNLFDYIGENEIQKRFGYSDEEIQGERDRMKINEMIQEEIENIFESKQTEQQATSFLNKNDVSNPEQIINDFKQTDLTKNQTLLPLMSQYYVDNKGNVDDVKTTFKTIVDLVNSGKITAPQKTNQGYVIKNKTFPDYIRFAEYIHGLESMGSGHKEWKDDIEAKKAETNVDAEQMFPKKGDDDKSGIQIFDGNDIGKCIKYTGGGLTGKAYQFCIGQPTNTMWQSYRDNDEASFYYIIDTNLDINNNFHIVVWMPTVYGVMLTNELNDTNTEDNFDDKYAIPEFGMGYREYLESKGVPVDIMKDVEVSDEEREETEKLSNSNNDIEWFKNLSYKDKSKYIGRGHLLGLEQFKYLWDYKNDKGGYSLLNQYLDTGQAIPEDQFNILMSDG